MMNNGRFPSNTLSQLYTGSRHYNLAESTTKDIGFGALIDLFGLEAIRNIKLDYGDSIEGLSELRDEIGKRCNVPSEWIVTTQGAAFALYLVAAELGKVGDTAVITAPYFQQAYNTLLAHGWNVNVAQNDFNNGYRLNLAAISDVLNQKTRLVSLASPQNPSGVSIPLATLEALLDIMAQKAPNAVLLVDETYREAAFEARNILASSSTLSNRVITCSSISKAYGAPGLRSGWLIVPDEAVRQRIITAKKNIVITNSVLIEQLTAVVLKNSDTLLQQQRSYLAPALALVTQWQADEHNYLDWTPPDAGALCCMRLNSQRFDKEALSKFWQVLAQHDTLLRPGLQFGSDNRHFRLGFGHLPYELLQKGLQNISIALKEAVLD